ncbi:MAG: tetratricopeptide repeat protein [Deltaproteobacteria bacterium]|nr:tetratricopeptide repeat protein [Deltaproteobacteria bacterium]
MLGTVRGLQGKSAEALGPLQTAAELLPRDTEAHRNLGNVLKDLGRLTEAEASYRRALEIKPNYAEAHSDLGNALKDQGRLTEAEASYRRALEIKPDYALAYYNLGNALTDQGRLTEAEAVYRRALEIKPNFAEAHNNLGNVLRDLSRLTEAEASCRQALEIKPDYALAHNNLGNVLRDQGRLTEAEARCRRALEIKINFAEAHNNLGNVLKDQGRLTEAEASYRRALEVKPDFALAHNNLGNALNDMGRFTEAEASYRRALEIKPNYAETHHNLGNALNDTGRLTEAETSYRRALEIKPNFAEAHNNLGNALKGIGRLTEAEASYRRALEIKPDYAEAHNNLGNAFKEQGRLMEAEASYRRALKIKPDYAIAHSNLLFTLSYTSHHLSNYLEEACRYGQMVARKVGIPFSAWPCKTRPERLKVGLVTGDLCNHPVGYFLESLLARINLTRIELIAYSTDNKVDQLTSRIKPYFADWKSLVGQSDEAAAKLIHADGVHILLDLSGHTAHNRLPVFAWKPALVQVTWLGYSATTGMKEMDYILGDPYVAPAEEENHFTEAVWRLPESYICFTPPDVTLKEAPLPAQSSNRITFGCFNNLTKMNDAVVALWSRVLQSVPNSCLFIKAKQLNDPALCDTTQRRFAACGITSDRLMLEGYSPTRAESLAAYHRVDIALDPFPYTGTTTTVEALWMGIPVITRRGDRFLSHVGESIAHNAGLADWIAADDDDYVSKAIIHTSDLERLAALRAGLRQQVLASPLFDAMRFARHFETALWGMWERWQRS